jgi:hypothetical protein
MLIAVKDITSKAGEYVKDNANSIKQLAQSVAIGKETGFWED